MFKVGDLVTRIGFTIASRDMYIDWTYEVSSVHHLGAENETLQLTGIDGHFYPARFVLAARSSQNSTAFSLCASNYMSNTKLDEEDKRIIGESLCSM